MCTIVVATRLWDAAPLVVAANRDEQTARPAAAPHRWARDDDEPIFAPRDLLAGGTWLGIRGADLFVGITNRATGSGSPPGPRSRGQLVLDALARGEAAAAASAIAALDPAEHAPFHLVMADRQGAYLVWNDGLHHHHETLEPGIHVISERSRGAAPTQRDALLRRRLDARGPEEPTLAQWRTLMAEHAANPFEGPCVHADERGYGTRCSTVVRLLADGGLGFFHADGRPCVTEYKDLSEDAVGGQ
ncbi:MAG: NRDE family protein [Myxococcota bacterium]